MNDIPEPNEDATPPAPRKTSGLAWGCVILFFIVLVVDIISIQMLGTNANNTFSTIKQDFGSPPVAPRKGPPASHK